MILMINDRFYNEQEIRQLIQRQAEQITKLKQLLLQACSDLNAIPAADVQPVDRWISVDDRLPEEQECVIVHEKDYGVLLGDYQGIKYRQPVWVVRKSGLIMRTTEVTHWQPLPEPPTHKI